MGFYSKELKNEFETVIVNEPAVFELLKVYCIKGDGRIMLRTGTAGPLDDDDVDDLLHAFSHDSLVIVFCALFTT